eukprot:scaffold102444_cov32-Tisochrysis_lutea.AAC.2
MVSCPIVCATPCAHGSWALGCVARDGLRRSLLTATTLSGWPLSLEAAAEMSYARPAPSHARS